MKTELPKQFLPVGGRPLLMRTLDAFSHYSAEVVLKLVLPESQFDRWAALCQEHGFDTNYQLIAGGETRFHSVQNGLNSIETNEGLVAVHDGVRPFVSSQIIASSFQKAR